MIDRIMTVLGIVWVALLLADTVLLMWITRYLFRLVWGILML